MFISCFIVLFIIFIQRIHRGADEGTRVDWITFGYSLTGGGCYIQWRWQKKLVYSPCINRGRIHNQHTSRQRDTSLNSATWLNTFYESLFSAGQIVSSLSVSPFACPFGAIVSRSHCSYFSNRILNFKLMHQLDYDVITVDRAAIESIGEKCFFEADDEMLFCRKFWPSS